jgi:hypothetical protein
MRRMANVLSVAVVILFAVSVTAQTGQTSPASGRVSRSLRVSLDKLVQRREVAVLLDSAVAAAVAIWEAVGGRTSPSHKMRTG